MSGDSQHELNEKAIQIADFPEEPRSARLPPPGEYLGLPKRLLTPTDSKMERSKGIWVKQDISVTHEKSSESLRDDSVQVEHKETKMADT